MAGFSTAFQWAFRQAIVRELDTPYMGLTAAAVHGNDVLANVADGHDRAPWEGNLRARPESAYHFASVAKPIAWMLTLRTCELAARIHDALQAAPAGAVAFVNNTIATQMDVTPQFVSHIRRLGFAMGPDSGVSFILSSLLVRAQLSPRGSVRYVPMTLGENTSQVTVRHLLRHEAGLDYGTSLTGDATPAERFRAIFGRKTQWLPGTENRYSNDNFIFLRYLLEWLTGEPYETFLRRHWLDKVDAGAIVTAQSGDAAPLYYAMDGYSGQFDGPSPGMLWNNFRNMLAASGLFGPASAIAAAVNPIRARTVLSEASVQSFLDEATGIGGETTPLGLRLAGHSGLWTLADGNVTGKAVAHVSVVKSTGLSVALALNAGPGAPGEVLKRVLDRLLPKIEIVPSSAADGCLVIRVTSPVGGAHIRLRTDALAPTAADQNVLGYVGIRQPIRAVASLFNGDKLILGPTFIKPIRPTVDAPWHAAALPTGSGLQAGLRWQRKLGTFANTTDVDWSMPDGTGTIAGISIPPAPANGPAIDPAFALRFDGLFFAATTAVYVFATNTDDGSRLLIDGVTVVDNDGLHDARQVIGAIALDAGYHRFELHYFQGSSDKKLECWWQASGKARRNFDGVLFMQP